MKKIKNTQQQAKLNRELRSKNIQSAFAWKGKNIPENVILVDDVMTSGSTLQSIAKILKQAGAQNIQAVVFAHS